jgi:ADP-heptose:LPS heptosyltransferase
MSGPVLLVGLSNIGDAVLTTPVLNALHQLFPDAPLDIVADRRSADVYEPCPFRRTVFYKEKRTLLRGLPGLLRQLRRERYELVVDLRTDFLAYLVRARARLAKWRAQPYGPHAVERHMGVIASLYGAQALPAGSVWPGPEHHAAAARALAAGVRWLGIGPGARWPPKIWPAPRYVELIAALRTEFGGVALFGDRADAGAARAIAAASSLPCVDLCGRTTVLEAAATLGRCACFVGNDSGLGHLAAAMGTPTLTLFGPGDPARYRPWGAGATWITAPGGDLSRLEAESVAAKLRMQCASWGERA